MKKITATPEERRARFNLLYELTYGKLLASTTINYEGLKQVYNQVSNRQISVSDDSGIHNIDFSREAMA